MTDKADISSSDNSNDSGPSDDGKTMAAETELSQSDIIARNREKAIQLRAAKRTLQQEPSKLVSASCMMSTMLKAGLWSRSRDVPTCGLAW